MEYNIYLYIKPFLVEIDLNLRDFTRQLGSNHKKAVTFPKKSGIKQNDKDSHNSVIKVQNELICI